MLSFTNVDTIASVARIFTKDLSVDTLVQLVFETESIAYFIGWLEYNVKFIFFLYDRNMSINCFLTCKDNFPNNSFLYSDDKWPFKF